MEPVSGLVAFLKPEQRKHWDSIRWLVDWEIRGEGRTTLLALAFIEQADKHLGEAILLWDHYNDTVVHHEVMVPVVDNLLRALQADPEEHDLEGVYWKDKTFVLDRVRRTLRRTQ
jgi:hypothetical protein